jgi:hypothetical protein
MKKLALILAVTLWAMPAPAGAPGGWLSLRSAQSPDALLPDRSGFSGDLSAANEREYAAIVMSVFRHAFARDVRARVIIVAPFSGGEYSIAIKERAGRFRVAAAHSTKRLWRYTASGRAQAVRFKDRLVPADYRQVMVERCSAPIGPKLGKDLVTVWQTMLTGAERHDWYNPPTGDARLYFSTSADKQILAGQTWASSSGDKVGSLIRIADTLNQYCLHKKRRLVTEVRTEVDHLLSVLKSEK